MIIKIKGSNVFSGLGNISELGQPYSVTVTCSTPGATIKIEAQDMTTVTSTSGTATMSNIPYGRRAYYTVSAEGYTTKTGSTVSGGTIPVALTAVNTGGGNTGGEVVNPEPEEPGTGGGSGTIVQIETGNYAIAGATGVPSGLNTRAATIEFFDNSTVSTITPRDGNVEWYLYAYNKSDETYVGVLSKDKTKFGKPGDSGFQHYTGGDVKPETLDITGSLFNNYKFKVCGVVGTSSKAENIEGDTDLWIFKK